MKKNTQFQRLAAGATLALALLVSPLFFAHAADHLDPSTRIDGVGNPADIGDVYAWVHGEEGDRTLVVIMTIGGPVAPVADQTAGFHPDVLYGVHVDRTGDHIADSNIWLRFGQNSLGAWGVQVVDLPGATGTVVGPVGETITDGSASVYTGLRDDPFFFDLEGFLTTLETGTVSFVPNRDFFAGQNISSVVLEMNLEAALAGGAVLNIWGTTARIGE
jgi:hypothetical protein